MPTTQRRTSTGLAAEDAERGRETPRVAYPTEELGPFLDGEGVESALRGVRPPSVTYDVTVSCAVDGLPVASLLLSEHCPHSYVAGEEKDVAMVVPSSRPPSCPVLPRSVVASQEMPSADAASLRSHLSGPQLPSQDWASSLPSGRVTPPCSMQQAPNAGKYAVKFPTLPNFPISQTDSSPLRRTDVTKATDGYAQEVQRPHRATSGVSSNEEDDGMAADVSKAEKMAPPVRVSGLVQGRADDQNLESSGAGLGVGFVSDASPSDAGGHPPTSLRGAMFHIFKAHVGVGVFLLPTYYQDAGYILGPLALVLLGVVMIECSLALLFVKQRIDRVEVETYPAVVGFVLGNFFYKFIQFSLVFTQFGFCIMYLQYAASTFAALLDKSAAYAVFVALITLAVTPMTLLSDKLYLLAYASALASAFVVIVLISTTVVDVRYLATSGVAAGIVPVIWTARTIVFLSGHMLALEGIGVVLPVENSVAPEKRVHFSKVLRNTLTAIVVFYVLFGVLGYAAYGSSLHTSVVLALPPSTAKKILQALLGISLIFGFPLQYVPAIQISERAFHVTVESDRKKAFLLRVVLNVVFGMMAVLIGEDTITIFASFLGSFAGVHLMITVPTLLALQVEHALNGDRDKYSYGNYLLLLLKGPYSIARCRYYLYLVFCAVLSVGGLYYTFVSVFGEGS